jgi:hypothetical protein
MPKLNQEDIKNINRSITGNETEAVIKSPPTRKSKGWTDSLLNSSRPLKKN